MKYRSKHWLRTALFLTWIALAFQPHPTAQTNDEPAKRPKPGRTHAQQLREAELWHALNQERNGAAAFTESIVSQDTSDIAVIQGDNRLITPANAFDLNGRAVLFTPSGAGYGISSASVAFDNNLGTKLDLTAAPAVNPKPGTDPGDDGYVLQDLGFNFNFYGTSFASVAVCSNGSLVFRPGNVSQATFDLNAAESVESLSILQSGLPRIAPYWHDLDATAAAVTGTRGIYLRRDSNAVVVTWNNIRDFPNDATRDTGVHRFQVTLFNDGRIRFTYDTAQLTSTALAGIGPGGTTNLPTLVDLTVPPGQVVTTPVAEVFSTSLMVDTFGTVQAFYATHPNRDVYDFVYLVTDFNFDLGGAFAFYAPLRNDAQGIGQAVGASTVATQISSARIQGVLNLSNINGVYPTYPTTRFLGANSALSIMGQEQGHRWMSYIDYPGTPSNLLLGRDDEHWSFFLNIESTLSHPAVPRSSSMEGNVWRDNGGGSFTSLSLIDGYSRLDQYIMGLRPASDVPDTFVIANPFNTRGATRGSGPTPNLTVNGTRQTVTINQILQANGARVPDANSAQKNFRAAVVLLVRQGTQPSAALLEKVTRYRLAWESYFAQSTDFLASINTGLADQTTSRTIATVSAASFTAPLAPGAIGALFGAGLTSGGRESATTQPLPTTLAGTQVLVNGVAAPLFFAGPTQINFQIPRTTSGITLSPSVSSNTVTLEVISNGQLIRAGALQLAPSVTQLFTRTQNGLGAAAAVDAITGAPEPFNATQANGQPNIIAVFGTGFGADATDVDGNAAGVTQATIDGAPVTVNYAGRAPGLTALNQFNVVFPVNLSAGTHTLVIGRSGIASRAVTIAVR